MANVFHKDLTGAELHEPKGIGGASANTVYVADGTGTGTWQKISESEIDTTGELGQLVVSANLVDLHLASIYYLAVPRAVTLKRAVITVYDAVDADTLVEVFNGDASTVIGNVTLTAAGSAAGSVFSLAISANNSFSEDTFVRLTSDAGATGAFDGHVSLLFTAA